MWKFLTAIIFLFSIIESYSQEYSHFTSWNRIVVQKKINKHWEVLADVHIRRQNDFNVVSINPLALKLMEGYRLTAVYRINNFAFSFAPFFLHSYPLYGTLKDKNAFAKSEMRPSVFLEWSKNMTDKWSFRTRLGYEYRFFKKNDDVWNDAQGRVRLRVQVRYAWNNKNTLFVSEEPLYNIPPNVPANSFNQNQLYFGYSHEFSQHFVTEVGYMWNHRQRASLVEFDEENALQTHFIFKF